uniref:Uncharacterized protein n=1 Tax=Mastacembelus armatus TaxID=205130 RepID=A0A3Q3S0M7_9TELE
MWHWEALWAIRWQPLCFLSTEVVVHIFFGFSFGPPSSTPSLPFLYAVIQADVGLFCCVLLSLSPLPPDYIPTSRREEEKKTSYAVHGLQKKSVKINTFKKKLNVLQFFSLPNIKWCFIFRLGTLSYANLFYSCSESCFVLGKPLSVFSGRCLHNPVHTPILSLYQKTINKKMKV